MPMCSGQRSERPDLPRLKVQSQKQAWNMEQGAGKIRSLAYCYPARRRQSSDRIFRTTDVSRRTQHHPYIAHCEDFTELTIV